MYSASKIEKIKNPLFYLILLLCIKAACVVILIALYQVGLAPDEAQYWTWSQELDWGYYSKPPAIAWQIWLTTAIFGHSELGVRMGAVVIAFLLPLAVYYVAKKSGLSPRTSFWAAIATAFSPLGIYLSLAATTDGGAIFFLTLAVAVIVKGVRDEKGPNYSLAGIWILLGGLFKWTAFVFWPFVFLFLLFFRPLRKMSLLGGVLISLIALLPSIYWNWTHDWVTFKHVGSAIGQTKAGNFTDFFAAQIGLISPLFFVLLVMSFFFLYRESNRALLFCASFPFAVLGYIALSFFKKIQPNWAMYLYSPGFVLIGWVGIDRLRKGRVWLHLGTWLSILIVAFAISIPWIQTKEVLPLPYKINPLRQSVGWEKLSQALKDAGYQPNNDFLFADKYQTASLLSFYTEGQKRAYFFNISAARKNQFSYWPQMQEKEVGKTGYFVVIENTDASSLNWYKQHYLQRLSPYFEKVEYKGAYPLFFAGGKPVKYAIIFRSLDYSGAAPEDPHKY